MESAGSLEGVTTIPVDSLKQDGDEVDDDVQFLYEVKRKGREFNGQVFSKSRKRAEAGFDFLTLVRPSQECNENDVLEVTENTIKYPELFQTEHPWRGIRIDVTLPPEDVQRLLQKFLPNVEFLSLIQTAENVEKSTHQEEFIQKILLRASKLSHLQIDMHLMKLYLYSILKMDKVRGNLKNVRHLEIIQWDRQRGEIKARNTNLPDHNFIDCHFVMNTMQLFMIPMKLESFRMANWEEMYSKEVQDLSPFIRKIVRDNSETLKELNVSWNLWGNEDLEAIAFPCLKKLTTALSVPQVKIESLIAFLKKNPLLEELTLVIAGPCERKLVRTISLLFNLKKLHVKAKVIGKFDMECSLSNYDWSFLCGMKYLKDFRAAIVYDKDLFVFPDLVTWLPRSQMERLAFKSIVFPCMRNLREVRDRNFYFSQYKNLKRLSIYRCANFADDSLMQVIIQNFSSLEELEVQYVNELSDAGITGEFPFGSRGRSLGNLKKLKSVVIRAVPRVTTQGILKAVAHESMKHLEYIQENRVEEPFIVQLLQQNPNLEKVALHTNLEIAEKVFNEANQRVTKFIGLGHWDPDNDSDSDEEEFDIASQYKTTDTTTPTEMKILKKSA